MYLSLSIFTVFLKNRNFISKIRRSKVTDYAALKLRCLLEAFAPMQYVPKSRELALKDYINPDTFHCERRIYVRL